MKLPEVLNNTKQQGNCHIWQGNVMSCGYGRVCLSGKYWRTHRLFYTLSKGDIPKGMLVCHSCDTPLCCNPEHLFLGTPKDNQHDAMNKGRHTKGTKVNTCKLTEATVLEIRDRWLVEGTKYGAYSRLGREYGVTEANIRSIVTRKSWKHI